MASQIIEYSLLPILSLTEMPFLFFTKSILTTLLTTLLLYIQVLGGQNQYFRLCSRYTFIILRFFKISNIFLKNFKFSWPLPLKGRGLRKINGCQIYEIKNELARLAEISKNWWDWGSIRPCPNIVIQRRFKNAETHL